MRQRLAAVFVALAATLAWAVPAHADSSATPPGPPSTYPGTTDAIARFEGRTIDLATGWGDARACVVLRRAGILDCFRTSAQAQVRAASLAASSFSCGSPLRLFEHWNYGGRELWFFDRGYWQNLGDYGFDNQLSSFIVGDCYAHLADYAWGGGYWYPGYTGPYASASYVGSSWNDRVSSIYIE